MSHKQTRSTWMGSPHPYGCLLFYLESTYLHSMIRLRQSAYSLILWQEDKTTELFRGLQSCRFQPSSSRMQHRKQPGTRQIRARTLKDRNKKKLEKEPGYRWFSQNLPVTDRCRSGEECERCPSQPACFPSFGCGKLNALGIHLFTSCCRPSGSF
ncbi:hypothetical protein BDW75DRAFT_57353 [Aspergillus navahoensis]